MADYWISQNRKYCDFCKCWITDNRPSIDFHEKGRRHQENVKKKLRNISRHSTQTQKDSTKFDATLKQMEVAALESYRRDVENNADLTSVAINKKIQDSLNGASGSDGVKKLWHEKKTRDGRTYYVNIMTNETVWQPPKDGYLSMEEQRELSLLEAKKQLKALEKHKRKQGLLTMQEIKQQEAEDKARQAREKLKERRVVDDLAPVTCGPLIEPGKTDPYGKWQTIKETPVVDLQLPQQEHYFEYPVVEYEPEPPVKEFKEKIVESLDDDDDDGETTVTTFKKRKIGSGAKRNTRQRLDDD